MNNNTEFDYICAGGGLSGLSAAFYLNKSGLKPSSVLVIDRDEKTENDHTWCFWETDPGPFEEIVFHRWKKLWFHGADGFSKLLEVEPFEYKMIRACDFYAFVKGASPEITFLQADVDEISNGIVHTSKGEFSAREFVFDSIFQNGYSDAKYNNLVQHFHGWIIETEEAGFDVEHATLFDFRIDQEDDCRFIYVLPYSQNRALVEYTVFSKQLLDKPQYEEGLRVYLASVLSCPYKIIETESGVIPMSDAMIETRPYPKVIRIGTPGGFVKPSTGYSFQRTQRRLSELVRSLEQTGEPTLAASSSWKQFLDSVLLNVLANGRHPADAVFTSLFEKNTPDLMLRFLDESTSLSEDLRVMASVPKVPFGKAALKEASKRIFR